MSRRELRLDSRRLALSMVLAVAVHAGLFFAIPAILRLENRKAPEYGGTVLVQLEEPSPPVQAPVVEPSAQPLSAQPEPAPAPEPAPEPAPAPEPTPAPKPVPAAKPAPAPKAAPVQKTTPAVRTAPKAQPATTAPVPSTPVVKPAEAFVPKTPAFREAGGKAAPSAAPAGAVPKAQAVAASEPTLPAAGKPGGTASAAGSVQRSGVGVSVPTQTTKPAGTLAAGSSASGLDLRALDKIPTATGPASGTGSPRTSTAASSGANDFSVEWDEPDAAKGRELLSAPLPNLPRRVQEEGLTLSLKVSFTVTPDGVVQARMTPPSAYPDVDAAVLEAVRHWRFNPAETTRTVSGTIQYTIRAR